MKSSPDAPEPGDANANPTLRLGLRLFAGPDMAQAVLKDVDAEALGLLYERQPHTLGPLLRHLAATAYGEHQFTDAPLFDAPALESIAVRLQGDAREGGKYPHKDYSRQIIRRGGFAIHEARKEIRREAPGPSRMAQEAALDKLEAALSKQQHFGLSPLPEAGFGR